MSNIEASKATVQSFWTAIATRDVEGFLATFAPGAVAHDPINKPSLKTPADRRAYIEGVFAAFSDIETQIDFSTICGGHTATKWTLTAKTAAGDPVRIEGVDVARHDENGLIAELWGYF